LAPAPAHAYHRWESLFSFADDEIVESSGFASSSGSDRVFYTHNDSGDSARFFVVDARGCTLVRYSLKGRDAVDWEDMARGPDEAGRSTLWFGDIGDNAADRALITVYAVAEPRVRAVDGRGPCAEPHEAATKSVRFDLVYEDGPHDAEALFVHPKTGRLYVVTKVYLAGETTSLYEAPRTMSRTKPNRLERVADLPIPQEPVVTSDPAHSLPLGTVGGQAVTGADMSPDATRVVVRTYHAAYEWKIRDGNPGRSLRAQPRRIQLPGQPQGEAISYSHGGRALLISSEDPLGDHPPVFTAADDEK
jgi:hypothetical protein